MCRRATLALSTCLGALMGVSRVQPKRLLGAWGFALAFRRRCLRCRRGLPQPQTLHTLHKTLISASKVHSKGHVAVVDSNGGCIITYTSTPTLVQKEIVDEPGAIRLCPENGMYIGYTKIQQHVSTQSDQGLCSVQAKQQSEVLRHSQRE